MLSRKHLGVEITVQRSGDCLVVCLAANAEDVGKEGNGNGLALKGTVHGYEMQNGRVLLELCSRPAVLLLLLLLGLRLHGAVVLRGNHVGG